jgi:hypothetical protein
MKLAIFRKLKPLLVILGWSASMAALTLATIFQGLLLPKVIGSGGGLLPEVVNASPVWLWIFYLGNFGICVLAALIISDLGTAIVSFFPSYIGAIIITYLILALPDFLGLFPYPGALEGSAVNFVFGAYFPLMLIINLTGTLAGVMLGEHFL